MHPGSESLSPRIVSLSCLYHRRYDYAVIVLDIDRSIVSEGDEYTSSPQQDRRRRSACSDLLQILEIRRCTRDNQIRITWQGSEATSTSKSCNSASPRFPRFLGAFVRLWRTVNLLGRFEFGSSVVNRLQSLLSSPRAALVIKEE